MIQIFSLHPLKNLKNMLKYTKIINKHNYLLYYAFLNIFFFNYFNSELLIRY